MLHALDCYLKNNKDMHPSRKEIIKAINNCSCDNPQFVATTLARALAEITNQGCQIPRNPWPTVDTSVPKTEVSRKDLKE